MAQLTLRIPSNLEPNGAVVGAPSLSADGRYVAFASEATNLVGQDTNGAADVFVYDRQLATTVLVSVAVGGGVGNGISHSPSISADGRHIVFCSWASDLVATPDTNTGPDVFYRNLGTGSTAKLTGNGPAFPPPPTVTHSKSTISPDGLRVLFQSDASFPPVMGMLALPSGQYLATYPASAVTDSSQRFFSDSNGACIDDLNNASFLDWWPDAPNPATHFGISCGGYVPTCSTLPVHDASVPSPSAGPPAPGQPYDVSRDLVYESGGEIWAGLPITGVPWTRELISVSVAGASTTGNRKPVCSYDGRYVAWLGTSDRLVPDPPGVLATGIAFVRDRATATTYAASIAADGHLPFGHPIETVAISGNGQYVAFTSRDITLVPGDTNGVRDLFMRDWRVGQAVPFGVPCAGSGGGCLVVPADRGAASGNSGQNAVGQYWRHQQLILANELPATLQITGLGVRQSRYGTAVPAGPVGCEIRIGYTTRTEATLSTNFASNFTAGPPVIVKPMGVTTIGPVAAGSPTHDVSQFEVTLAFATPFSWSQGNGNLLVDIINDSSIAAPAMTADAHVVAGVGNRMVSVFDPATPTGFLSRLQVVLCLRSATAVPPLLYAELPPVIGSTYRVALRQGPPAGATVRLMGLSSSANNGVPLPFSLAPLGAPLCQQFVSGESIEFLLTDGAGRATSLLAIPPVPLFYGLQFFNQFATLDASANALGMAFTQALSLRVGRVQQ